MTKILIVDDSETLRSQVRRAIETSGYQVIEGTDGFDGIQKIQENPDIRLILCDVNMPKMDGLTMCKKVRENPSWNHISILMLTTEANPEMKKVGKEAGVVAWISKPFSEDKLASVFKKVLGET